MMSQIVEVLAHVHSCRREPRPMNLGMGFARACMEYRKTRRPKQKCIPLLVYVLLYIPGVHMWGANVHTSVTTR